MNMQWKIAKNKRKFRKFSKNLVFHPKNEKTGVYDGIWGCRAVLDASNGAPNTRFYAGFREIFKFEVDHIRSSLAALAAHDGHAKSPTEKRSQPC